jgi:EAL domain-containing protein (putative c-di-GMP-specific phosphodiesterase class I)
MFHALGVVAVTKGIESQEVVDRLKEAGCEEGQGFHLGRPVPALLLEAYLPNI